MSKPFTWRDEFDRTLNRSGFKAAAAGFQKVRQSDDYDQRTMTYTRTAHIRPLTWRARLRSGFAILFLGRAKVTWTQKP